MSETPAPSMFERLGGEDGVRALVDRFYDLMDTLPEVQPLRALHPSSLHDSRDKLFWFLCGWLGGPQHYVARKGHPRLRARHMPFRIDEKGRDQWMLCMRRAMTEIVQERALEVPAETREKLDVALFQLADHMRNVAG